MDSFALEGCLSCNTIFNHSCCSVSLLWQSSGWGAVPKEKLVAFCSEVASEKGVSFDNVESAKIFLLGNNTPLVPKKGYALKWENRQGEAIHCSAYYHRWQLRLDTFTVNGKTIKFEEREERKN